MLLGDNVIIWHSRKHDLLVWAVNRSATAVFLRSHTTVSVSIGLVLVVRNKSGFAKSVRGAERLRFAKDANFQITHTLFF